MKHDTFILMIRKYRFFYLFLFIVATLVGWKVLKPFIVEYSSYSSFYISNEGISNPTMFPRSISGESSRGSLVQERFNQMLFSSEMQDHLINKFNLYEHYGFDSTKQYSYEMMTKRMSGKISYDKISGDIAGVRVLDNNNLIAAEMANEIVSKLNQMNMEYLFNKVKGNILHNEILFSELEQSNEKQNENLISFLRKRNEINEIPSALSKSNNPQVKELELALSEATFRLKEVSGQLVILHGVYKEALNLMDTSGLNSITVIKKAYPEFKSKDRDRVLLAGLFGLTVLICFVLLQYYYFAHLEDFKIIFGK